MNPRRRFPDFMASCFKMSQHRRELQIADCKLRISGFQPGVIFFASKNWAETPLAFKPAGRNPHSGNANGVPSFSPGLPQPRSGEGYSGFAFQNNHEPRRGSIRSDGAGSGTRDATPLGLFRFVARFPG